MKKIIILLLIFQINTTARAQEKFALNLGMNGWYTFEASPTIKHRYLNASADVIYKLNKNAFSLGYNFSYLNTKNSSNPYSIFFSDINFNFCYDIGKKKKHIFFSGFGLYLSHNLHGTRVSTFEDDPFYLGLTIYSPPDAMLDPDQYGIFKKMPFFISSGYKYYFVKNFFLNVSGRVSLIKYTTPVGVDVGFQIKRGVSYTIFYGLGYTFGRNKE